LKYYKLNLNPFSRQFYHLFPNSSNIYIVIVNENERKEMSRKQRKEYHSWNSNWMYCDLQNKLTNIYTIQQIDTYITGITLPTTINIGSMSKNNYLKFGLLKPRLHFLKFGLKASFRIIKSS
jgi:hypothetical protein